MLRSFRFVLFLVFLAGLVPVCRAQSAPQAPQSAQSPSAAPVRDQQALAVLTRCVNAIGGAPALAGLQDYTGRGNITYFWAGQEVNGPVTVQGAHADQFRLEAMLAQGTRSWVINGGQGTITEPDGKQSSIPIYNGLALGNLTLPYLSLRQALSDPSVTVTFLEPQAIAGTQVNRIRIQQSFPAELDPKGDWVRWSAREYLIDTSTFRIVSTRAVLHSNDSFAKEFTQEILFSDYRQVNGIAVPFSIVETIGGQKTWAIQLNSINFNTGLTDAIFQM